MRNNWRTRLTWLTIAAFLVVGLVGAPAASAQSSLDDPSAAQYDPPLPPDEGTAGASASGASGLDENIGSLPFTGMDVLIIAGVALLLTGTGFALRRLSTPPEPRG